MPATAGRVRMPANNRVHSSAALQTHGIWQSAIGYDPYAPNKESLKSSDRNSNSEGVENAYASFQGLLALARITGSNSDEMRGTCKKCGRVGHLTFQCRNFLSLKEVREKDVAAIHAAANSIFDVIKNAGDREESEREENSEDDTDSSDSDVDPEIEKIIAARLGKKMRKGGEVKEDGEDKGSRSTGRSSFRRDEIDEDGKKKERKRRRRHRGSSDEDEDEDERRRHRMSRREKNRRNHRKEGSSDDDEPGSEYERHIHCSRRHRRRYSSEMDNSQLESRPNYYQRRKGMHRHQKRSHCVRGDSDSCSSSSSSESDRHRERHKKRRYAS